MSKGLEALEELRQNNKDNSHLFDNELLNTIEKELKALEIIKEKGIYWGIGYQPFEKENDYRAWDNEWYMSVKLSKEEYELLKEVLL